MSKLDAIRNLTAQAEAIAARINDAYMEASAEGHSTVTMREAAALGKLDHKRSALARPCPNCQSPEGRHCTEATSTGRRAVGWFHYARVENVTHVTP